MNNWTTINKKFETLFFRRINKAINVVFNEFVEIVENQGLQAGQSYLNRTLTNPALSQEVLRLYTTVGTKWADLTTRDLKQQQRQVKRASFGLNEQWIAFIRAYLAGHITEKITFTVNETLKEHLLLILNKAVEQGWGIDETVRYLRKDDFTEMQAARIARTEVNRAANAGVLAAGETYEYEMQKEWISVQDNRTRGVSPQDHASHLALNETKIDFDDLFVDSRNGDKLQAPGDPKASAASTINCRCQMGLSPKRDQQGRLIPKRRTTTVIYPNQNRPIRTITI